MSSKSFTVSCTLSRNGYRIKTSALANSRANAFALLDTECARKMLEYLNTPFEPLEKSILVKGYNGRAGKPITLILRVHLQVNGQQLYNMPFLITDLGNHSVIL